MAVTVDEAPATPNASVTINIDGVAVVNCNDWWIGQLANVYTSEKISGFITQIKDHLANEMGYTMTPQLESDIEDAIAYIGTLG